MIDLIRLKSVVVETGVEKLKIMCSGEMEVDWQNLLDLQTIEDGRSLKATDDDKITRLAESLIRFGIVNNLQIWVDENKDLYCFDAHHRVKAFAALVEVGVKISPLPATRCLAENKTEARKLLLVKESAASWVDINVVPDYLSEIGFNIKIAEHTIDLPGFEWKKVDDYDLENIPEFDPNLPTGGRASLRKASFTLSEEQAIFIYSLIKEEIKTNSSLDDPAGVNENRNGNALYSICKKASEK